ncbi:IS5 family transposase [Oligoflexus sp.]|uniref:IS5 family transposase n=1 Tax=Oligoflexus sp. TaxID=1971216 RepID=UPI0039C8CC63
MARTILDWSKWRTRRGYLFSQGVHNTKQLYMRVEGMLWRARTGSPWRDLPPRFGPWSSVYNLFNRWSIKGILGGVLKIYGFNPEDAWNCIYSTINRAHQHASGGPKGYDHAIGRSKGGLTTKVNMLSDAHGNPVTFELNGGNAHDMSAADLLCKTPISCLLLKARLMRNATSCPRIIHPKK